MAERTTKAEQMNENLVVCSKWDTVTRRRVRPSTLNAGKCKTKVFTDHPQDVAAEIFDRRIARSTVPVLVDV